jgi:hypothetical protein
MANKKNILQECVTIQPGRKVKTSKYEMSESELLEWFKQKTDITYINSRPNVETQKAEEAVFKLNTEFTPLNGRIDRFINYVWLHFRITSNPKV